MSLVGILAEKPSAARNFAKALGGAKGSYKGTDYVIVPAAGHLYEFRQPHEMVPADKSEKYQSWNIANLPWNENDFHWEYSIRGEYRSRTSKSKEEQERAAEAVQFAERTLGSIREVLNGCTEICIATDVDPTGEGQLLAWEIIDGLGLQNKKITRMYHQDEAPASVQKAFEGRKPLPPMREDPEYRKALGYLGSHSGRDGDKVAAAGLTPKAIGTGVTFAEANLTFLCKKLYQGPFEREGLADEINNGIYKNWQPHWMFVGEILEVQSDLS